MNEDDNTLEDRIYKILIVDDEKDTLEAMQLILKNANQFKSTITTVADSKAAMLEVKMEQYDLVLSDYKLPDMNGVDLLTWMKDKYPRTVRILTTGYSDVDVARDAINKANVHNYIEKPWDNDELKLTIYEALTSRLHIKGRNIPDRGDFNRPLPHIPPPPRTPGPPPLDSAKREPEKKPNSVTEVVNVTQALKLVDQVEINLKGFPPRTMPRQRMMLEFNSVSEFNKFSFEIEKKENAHIENVQVFVDKYIISISVYPSSYHFLS